MPRTWPSCPTDNEVMLYRYRKGGHNRERNRHIPHTSPPLRLVVRLRLQKGRCICGTLRYIYIPLHYNCVCVLPRGWYICTCVFSMWRGGICMYVSYLCSTLDAHTLHIGRIHTHTHTHYPPCTYLPRRANPYTYIIYTCVCVMMVYTCMCVSYVERWCMYVCVLPRELYVFPN